MLHLCCPLRDKIKRHIASREGMLPRVMGRNHQLFKAHFVDSKSQINFHGTKTKLSLISYLLKPRKPKNLKSFSRRRLTVFLKKSCNTYNIHWLLILTSVTQLIICHSYVHIKHLSYQDKHDGQERQCAMLVTANAAGNTQRYRASNRHLP